MPQRDLRLICLLGALLYYGEAAIYIHSGSFCEIKFLL